MKHDSMHLNILVPFKVFLEKKNVKRIVAESIGGSFGILPNRLDCASKLIPGILICESDSEGEVYIAIDEGTLVKTGKTVNISIRNAYISKDLATLRDHVENEFRQLNEQEIRTKEVLKKLESEFLRRLSKFHRS